MVYSEQKKKIILTSGKLLLSPRKWRDGKVTANDRQSFLKKHNIIVYPNYNDEYLAIYMKMTWVKKKCNLTLAVSPTC